MESAKLIETIKKAQNGNDDALQDLYLDTYRSVYYLALKTLKNPEDAEDITQEVFIAMREKISELREPAAFYRWINRITANKCANLLKKHRALTANDNEEIPFEPEEDNHLLMPDKAFDDAETRRLIGEVIDNLPDNQRVCIYFYYYQQMTIAQISEELGVNENTVKSRLALARGKIKAELERKEREEGIRLYAVPLALTPILRKAFEEFVMPDGAAERIWENISKVKAVDPPSDNSGGSNDGGSPSGSGGTSTVLSATVKTGMTLATKIIIGVVAAAVVTAGVIFLPPLFNSTDDATPPIVTDIGSTQPGTETPDITQGITDPTPEITSEPPTAEPDTSPEPPTTQPPTQPIDPNARGNSVGNIVNMGIVAIQGDRIFYRNYSDEHKIYSMNTDGSDKKKLNDEASFYINVVGDRVYYRLLYDVRIYSMNTDGSDRKKFHDEPAYDIYVVGDRIYYSGGGIYSMNTDGSERQKLNDDNAYYINVIGDTIYYQIMGAEIYSMKTDGSDRKKLNDDISMHINVVGDRIYYRNGSDGDKIYSIKTDGNDRKKLNDDESWHINVVGDRIYYCNVSDGYKLYSMNTDGSGRQKLNDDPSNDINIIGNRIYYNTWYELYSIKTDGTDRRLMD